MEHSFEDVLIRKWQQMCAPTPRNVFVPKFANVISLFLGQSIVNDIVEAEEADQKVPTPVLVQALKKESASNCTRRRHRRPSGSIS